MSSTKPNQIRRREEKEYSEKREVKVKEEVDSKDAVKKVVTEQFQLEVVKKKLFDLQKENDSLKEDLSFKKETILKLELKELLSEVPMKIKEKEDKNEALICKLKESSIKSGQELKQKEKEIFKMSAKCLELSDKLKSVAKEKNQLEINMKEKEELLNDFQMKVSKCEYENEFIRYRLKESTDESNELSEKLKLAINEKHALKLMKLTEKDTEIEDLRWKLKAASDESNETSKNFKVLLEDKQEVILNLESKIRELSNGINIKLIEKEHENDVLIGEIREHVEKYTDLSNKIEELQIIDQVNYDRMKNKDAEIKMLEDDLKNIKKEMEQFQVKPHKNSIEITERKIHAPPSAYKERGSKLHKMNNSKAKDLREDVGKATKEPPAASDSKSSSKHPRHHSKDPTEPPEKKSRKTTKIQFPEMAKVVEMDVFCLATQSYLGYDRDMYLEALEQEATIERVHNVFISKPYHNQFIGCYLPMKIKMLTMNSDKWKHDKHFRRKAFARINRSLSIGAISESDH